LSIFSRDLSETEYVEIVLKIMQLHHATDGIFGGTFYEIFVTLAIVLCNREYGINDCLRETLFEQI
jgi:hypothetical protein